MDSTAPLSATEPDWQRERITQFWAPGPRLLRTIRRYQHHRDRRGFHHRIMRRYWAVMHRFWSVITQCEIHLNTEIGGGLLLTHPQGIVIHPRARIGPNCAIFQQVTIGLGRTGVPRIGGNVDISTGAKIIGNITIGDHAIIGANAVVTKDVPPGGVAVGVPARVLRIDPLPRR